MKITHAVIIGATSSLAVALSRALAAKGVQLTLCGRDESELQSLAGDLTLRYGVSVNHLHADLAAPGFTAEALLKEASDFDALFLLAGDMGTCAGAENANEFRRIVAVNYTAPALLMEYAAARLAAERGGVIVAVSSVAGDRGRAGNYAYGSAKAALSAFASGLRNRYARSDVHVMTVKPGFVDTPMTWGMQSPLIASREAVSTSILRAVERKKDTLYAPFFWYYIMLIIRLIPEKIFKRLKL